MPARKYTKKTKKRSKKTRKVHKKGGRRGGNRVPSNEPNLPNLPNNALQQAVNAANMNMVSGLSEEEWDEMSDLRAYFGNNGELNAEERQEIRNFLYGRVYELQSEGDTNPSLEDGELPNIENEETRQKINDFLQLLRKHNEQDLQQTIYQFGLVEPSN